MISDTEIMKYICCLLSWQRFRVISDRNNEIYMLFAELAEVQSDIRHRNNEIYICFLAGDINRGIQT